MRERKWRGEEAEWWPSNKQEREGGGVKAADGVWRENDKQWGGLYKRKSERIIYTIRHFMSHS